MLTWVCSTTLLTVLVVCLHIQAEQTTIILMPTKIQIIMSNSVNPILLRPVFGVVLAIGSVLLKLEQLMSWLQSGYHAVSFFLWCYSVCKTTQECSSDAESVTLLS